MSQFVNGHSKTLVAGESLVGKGFYIGQLDATGKLEVGEGATDLLVGIIRTEAGAGEAAAYQFSGTAKVKLGVGGAAIGAYLTSDASGTAIATTTNGNVVIGRALEAGDAGDIIEVQLGIHKAWFA